MHPPMQHARHSYILSKHPLKHPFINLQPSHVVKNIKIKTISTIPKITPNIMPMVVPSVSSGSSTLPPTPKSPPLGLGLKGAVICTYV